MKLSTGRIFSYFVIFSPLIISLIFSRYFYNPFEYPKFIFLLISSYLFVIFVFKLKLFEKLKNLFRTSKTNQLALFYICIMLIADLLGVSPLRSFWGSLIRQQGFISLIAFFVLYLSVQLIDFSSLKIVTLFTKVSEVVIWIMGIVGIFQIVGVYLFHLPIILFQGRLILTFGNPDFLGVFLVMLLPLFLFSNNFSSSKKILRRVMMLIVLEILIILTQSLSAIVASLLIYFIWTIFVKKKILLFISIVFVCFILIFIPQNFKKYSIWDSRQIIYTQAIKKIVEKPFLGYGQDNFELVFPKELNYRVDSSHNIFLETLLASGIIGFIPFSFLLFLQLKKGLQLIQLSIFGFLITAMFNPLSLANIVLFWFFMGINSKYIDENKQ